MEQLRELGDLREHQAAMPIERLDGDLGDGPLTIHQTEQLVLAWTQAEIGPTVGALEHAVGTVAT